MDMEDRIQLPLEEIKLAFAASCVEGAARKLGVPYIEVLNSISFLEIEERYQKEKDTWRELDMDRINDPTYQPYMKWLLISHQIGGIAYDLSQRLDISPSRALDLFYRSKTCAQLHDKKTGLYLMSNGYIADDFILEMQGRS